MPAKVSGCDCGEFPRPGSCNVVPWVRLNTVLGLYTYLFTVFLSYLLNYLLTYLFTSLLIIYLLIYLLTYLHTYLLTYLCLRLQLVGIFIVLVIHAFILLYSVCVVSHGTKESEDAWEDKEGLPVPAPVLEAPEWVANNISRKNGNSSGVYCCHDGL